MTNRTSSFLGQRGRPRVNLRALSAATSLCVLAAGAAHAQVTENVLHVFGIESDGGNPTGELLADNTGPSGTLRGLYGTTNDGANDACTEGGCGMAFKMTPSRAGRTDWKESALWNFTGGAGGAQPLYAGLFAMAKRITAGTTLYGTTWEGGANNVGTVFALTGKKLTTLWSFTGGSDGGFPEDGVVADKSGSLYVSTATDGQNNSGTIIKLTPPAKGQNTWTETTIWAFTNKTDGRMPTGLIIDASGVLFGTATYGGGGGNGCDGLGCGTVFSLTPPTGQQTAWTEQILWTFTGGTDGNFPSAPLIAGKNGALYGTTAEGGNDNLGTTFSLVPTKNGQAPWTEQILWSFTGGSDGAYPYAPVVLDKSGALYGTTYGETGQYGSVFKLTPAQGNAWRETTLWDFSGTNGSAPLAGLTADKSGVLYGTTSLGGSGRNCSPNVNGCGVAFSLAGTGFTPR